MFSRMFTAEISYKTLLLRYSQKTRMSCLSSQYNILGLTFSACEALPSNAVDGTMQILAVIVIEELTV